MRVNDSDCRHGTRLLPSILHHSPSSRPGGRVAPSATGRFQTQKIATSLTTTRPIVLDCPSPLSGWADTLIIVNSDTVVSWHRAGFRLLWRWRSRAQPCGRPKISEELRQLIRRMKCDNPWWGAPRIHGELLQLGFKVSEPTVSRYLQGLKQRADNVKVKRWLAFLHNHREVIAAFDFFTVPTLSFRVLYYFFLIAHHRRQILHFNTTPHPTSEWIVQQLREALPLPCKYRYVVFDRDSKFGVEVQRFLKASGIKAVRTSAVPGRMESRNDGWAVSAASCLIM